MVCIKDIGRISLAQSGAIEGYTSIVICEGDAIYTSAIVLTDYSMQALFV